MNPTPRAFSRISTLALAGCLLLVVSAFSSSAVVISVSMLLIGFGVAVKASGEHADEVEPALASRILKTVINELSDGIIVVLDREMRVLYAGGKGLPKNSPIHAIKRGDHLPGRIHPAFNQNSEKQLQKAFEGETVSYEVMADDKAFIITTFPVSGDDQVDEIIVFIEEITGRIQLENNLKKLQEREKELNLLRTRFVTLASHEFRTPLSTILTSVFLLENYKGEDYETEKTSYIDKIKRAVHNLTDLLNDFLSIGKLEEGRIKVSYSDVKLNTFFENVMQDVMSSRKVEQTIVYKCNSPDTIITTDKYLLRNIVTNLLTNAIKYSRGEEEVSLFVDINQDNLRIKVMDQGIGIPENEQSQIFKRFYRGEQSSNIEGTGLGLNIVKKYVRLLRGTIEFTSEVGVGSTFIVTIPSNKRIEK